jgi:uncharacterized protein involved in type VI secretion and phage assembly
MTDMRYACIHAATVVSNTDPDGRGRLKLRVPGLIDESSWVYPGATIGGGAPQEGLWHTPAIGADVNVFFLGGDPNQPRWMAGHWSSRSGVPEAPTVVREANPDELGIASRDVHCWETTNWVFLLDDREGRRRAIITAKPVATEVGAPNPDSGTQLVVELDLENQTIALSAAGGIALRTAGTLDLQGTAIQIGGRVVIQSTGRPI